MASNNIHLLLFQNDITISVLDILCTYTWLVHQLETVTMKELMHCIDG